MKLLMSRLSRFEVEINDETAQDSEGRFYDETLELLEDTSSTSSDKVIAIQEVFSGNHDSSDEISVYVFDKTGNLTFFETPYTKLTRV